MDSPTKPTRRSRAGDAQRDAVLAQYGASGLTQRAFCEQVGLPLSTLQWWLVRSRRPTGGRRPAITFAELPTPMAAARGWAVEITTPDGWTIRFRDPQSASALRAWRRNARC